MSIVIKPTNTNYLNMLEDIHFKDFKLVDGSVHPEEYKALIRFFSNLEVAVDDITSEQQRGNSQKVVTVNYNYNNKVFKTKPLFYKHVDHSSNVKEADKLTGYFGDDVFWLDIGIHKWPKPKGETDIDSLIINDMTDDLDFRKFLKLLANNSSQGTIQRITKAGRSNQYFRNLENNNHWHDLILMIKEFIKHQGNVIDKKFYKPLVFKWDGNKNTERLRSSLSPHFGDRLILQKLGENIKNYISIDIIKNNNSMINNCIKLLKYKKQIILQGPPGTGKTRLAKELANEMSAFSHKDIANHIMVGDIIQTYKGKSFYEVEAINPHKIVLKGKKHDDINKKDISFNRILKYYHRKEWLSEITDGEKRGACAIAYHLYKSVKPTEYVKTLQFHPSYTYEDFIRGIVSKPNEDDKGIVYIAENKILAEFALKALNNFRLSSENNNEAILDKWIDDKFEEFKFSLEEELNAGEVALTDSISLFNVENDCFRYAKEWRGGSRLNFNDVKEVIKAVEQDKIDKNKAEIPKDISVHAHYRATYYLALVRKFKSRYTYAPTRNTEELKNYVLIIDEINRANLSSVLGELIYALEYRGEEVESMYEVNASNKLILPPNLFIIGTMNTADRSVGHIDYAIRRRFAFVDVLPQNLKKTDGLESFDENLFTKVASLFDTNLSPEFEKDDVQLGHSYFIDKSNEKDGADMNMRWEYEIKPILLEYAKDGILIGENIITEIKDLKVSV